MINKVGFRGASYAIIILVNGVHPSVSVIEHGFSVPRTEQKTETPDGSVDSILHLGSITVASRNER